MTPALGYIAKANRYRRGVLDGSIPACQWVRFACQRQHDDLLRQGDPAWPYRFDPKAATRICRFMERLPHIKGPLARARARLELGDWQCFIYTTAYGWLHKPAPPPGWPRSQTFHAGKRRFRTVYLEVPRGNGKSFMLSGGSLYALGADGEAGPEVYSAATTRDQAKIVFDSARKMAKQTPKLCAALGITIGMHALTQEKKSGTFQPLSADEDSLEGKNIHYVGIDELHAHKKRAVYDVCESAMGKRDQPMMWIITTAGSDRAGICYEVRGYVCKVLNRSAYDETWFGMIYTIDRDENAEDDDSKGDDWQLEASWRKANPNWNISVEPNHIARMATKAMQLPAAQANFKTKHLNVWVNADSAWMDMRAWHRCTDTAMQLEQFEGQACLIGLDLASKIDIAAKVRLFWRTIETEIAGVLQPAEHYYLFGSYYVPQAAVEEARNSQYSGWREAGLMTETLGDVIDYATIENDIKDDALHFGPIEVAYDPWQALQMAQNLQAVDIPVVEYRQTVANFSAPMKELQALAMQGRLHHNGDPILTWMVSNVVCHRDAKDNIYPRKERDENMIDGVVASIMALGRRMAVGNLAEPTVHFV